jgi:hypothetical protein
VASPELSVEDAYDLLRSWAATLANMARSKRSFAELKAVLEGEVEPAFLYLEDATRREAAVHAEHSSGEES